MGLIIGSPRMRKCLLVLAPHTDDGELGCGGTITRFLEEHWQVHYVAFSGAEKALPPDLPSDTLRMEVIQATRVLGIPRRNLRVLNYPLRDFFAHRQDILEDMVKLQKELRPALVLIPSPNDTHQDHQTIAQEGFRAFKRTRLLGYELPWNNLTFHSTAFVPLGERHLSRKVAALAKYKSQAGRDYCTEEFVRSLARTRGVQIGCRYAEAFEVLRWVMD
jgi:LmbE family N-acetylglucosaminyl deacetylase